MTDKFLHVAVGEKSVKKQNSVFENECDKEGGSSDSNDSFMSDNKINKSLASFKSKSSVSRSKSLRRQLS